MSTTTHESSSVTVQIDGKNIKVNCPAEHVADLEAAASFLDQELMQIKNTGTTQERAAIITALNLSHRLLQQDKEITSLLQVTSAFADESNT